MARTWSQGQDRNKPACGKGKHEALEYHKPAITDYDKLLLRWLQVLAFALRHGVVHVWPPFVRFPLQLLPVEHTGVAIVYRKVG